MSFSIRVTNRKSKNPRKNAMTKENAITSTVKEMVCSFVGQFTWRISARVSLRYSAIFMRLIFLLKNPSRGVLWLLVYTPSKLKSTLWITNRKDGPCGGLSTDTSPFFTRHTTYHILHT